MATLPPLTSPPIIRLEFLQSSGPDVSLLTRLWVSYTGGPPTAADLTTYLANIGPSWAAYISVLQDTSTTLNEIIATDMASPSGAVASDTTVHTGIRGAASLPASTAAVISHTIQRRYRGGKPRTYLRCGTFGDLLNDQEWTPAFLASIQSDWGGFIAAILAHSYSSFAPAQVMNVSYYSGGTWEAYGTPVKYRRIPTLRAVPIEDVITGHVTRQKLGTQRRRI